ncbi:lactate utilization protein B/C [Spirosoma sp. KCTC 42546]|uniref:LutC/YkgG family protein n=1 Tax=Spirosoma sp. KCTC 42546 TaxID=2520506 RepID=UPI00115A9061|nr:LUD domain-containing protein [Spirosoma sp. KCTC 42546]QDK79934.1 lactate utilization protein B/C [Spirosoma sp. KCTC 42546]
MSSRETILAAVLKNKPSTRPLPDIDVFKGDTQDIVSTYCDVFTSIGGHLYVVTDFSQVTALVKKNFDSTKRMITTLLQLSDTFDLLSATVDPHTFNDVELAIIKAELAVAENGAVWLPEQRMGQRILPYICQHLAVVVEAETIVPTLHEAYYQIGEGAYGFGAFIGGPSKTADIEQALVMGAHGPITMTVFVMRQAHDSLVSG